jgi:hypothetical protein
MASKHLANPPKATIAVLANTHAVFPSFVAYLIFSEAFSRNFIAKHRRLRERKEAAPHIESRCCPMQWPVRVRD